MIDVMDFIRLDSYTKTIKAPTLRLLTKSDTLLGSITNFSDWNVSIVGKGLDEISFSVHKYIDGIKCPVWEDLVDFKTVEVNGIAKFEIQVSYTDSTETIKSIHGVSLENELGQLTINYFHVNDDDAMNIDDSLKVDNPNWDYRLDTEENIYKYFFVPTVFYRDSYLSGGDLSDEYKEKYAPQKTSLLHRILADKAPHWSVKKGTNYLTRDDSVDTVAELVETFQREYTVDGETIYDFLNGDITENSNVVFEFDTIKREITWSSIIPCYDSSGEIIENEIGHDTNILVSKTKLANEISISSNKDELKTCFRVEGGDEMMNNMVRAANMNGSNYIYQFSSLFTNDMSDELLKKLKEYSDEVDSKRDEYDEAFNELIDAYENLEYIKSKKMPGTSIDESKLTPYSQWNNIAENLKSVGVNSRSVYNSEKYASITSNVEAMANVYIDSGFETKIIYDTTSYTVDKNKNKYIWKGVVVVKKIKSDNTTEEVYPTINQDGTYPESAYLTINVVEDKDSDNLFTKQKLQKALAKLDMTYVDATEDLQTYQDWYNYFKDNYCVTLLDTYKQGYNECLSTLDAENLSESVDWNVEDDTKIPDTLYKIYYTRFQAASDALKYAQSLYDVAEKEVAKKEEAQEKIVSGLDIKSYLGNSLYNEFCKYRRDGEYTNSNYITTDDMDTSELLNSAKKLIEDAEKELKKACVLQRTATVSLANLVAMEEFQPLLSIENNNFNIWNYIRVKTDDEIIKLRIIGVDFNGDDWTTISVTFSDQIECVDGTISDLENIINQSSSIATSYDATVVQAQQGSVARNMFSEMYSKGLNAAKTMLTNNDNNEVTITNAGIIARRMDDEGSYGDKQLRITGNIMAFTDNSWRTVKMAIGETELTYPGETEPRSSYGIIAEHLVGKLVAGEQMYIGNSSGSVEITGDGIRLDGGTISWSDKDGNPSLIKQEDIENLEDSLSKINEDIGKVDGKIKYYSQASEPEIPEDKKSEHDGDVWFVDSDSDVGKYKAKSTYVYDGTSGTWNLTVDPNLEKLAKSKAQVFTSQPTVPYYIGDVWVKGGDDGTYYCNTTRESGDFNSGDWAKTDTSLNTFINGEFEELKDQVDKKIETYYQSTVPSEPDDGDLWYCTADIYDGSVLKYKSGMSYRWNKNDSEWKEMDVPKSVYDEIDGKKTIYSSIDSTTNAEENDLLVPESDITIGDKKYCKEKIYQYINSSWVEVGLSKEAEHAVSNSYITPSEKQSLKTVLNEINSDYDYYSGIGTSTKTKESGIYKMYMQGTWDNQDKCKNFGIGIPDTDTPRDGYYMDYNTGRIFAFENGRWIIVVSYEPKFIDDDFENDEYYSAYYTIRHLLIDVVKVDNVNETTTLDTDDKALYENSFLNYYNVKGYLNSYIQKENIDVEDNFDAFKNGVIDTLNGNSSTVISKDSIISPKIGGGYLYIVNKNNDNTINSFEINPKLNQISSSDGEKTSGNILMAKVNNEDVFHLKIKETYDYVQNTLPSSNWTASEMLNNDGKSWKCTDDISVTEAGYVKYYYRGNAYVWNFANKTWDDSQTSLYTEPDLYIKGNISADSGNIGNWDISNGNITYGDSTSYLTLDANAKSIHSHMGNMKTILSAGYLKSTDGTYESTLTSGCLHFGIGNGGSSHTNYATFSTSELSDGTTSSLKGVLIESSLDSSFIAFSNRKKVNNEEKNITNFVLNYGRNPSGYTEDTICFGNNRITDKLYMGSNKTNYIASRTDGFYTDGSFGVGGAGYTDYKLSVNGAIRAGNVEKIGDLEWVGIYCAGRGYFASALCPATSGVYLGQPNFRWGRLYTSSIDCSGNISTTGSGGLYSSEMSAYIARYYLYGDTLSECSAIGNNSYPTRIYGSSTWMNKQPTYGSDERIKKNFASLEKYEDLFMDLKPLSFNYRDDDSDIHFGVVAQDVKKSMDKYGIDGIALFSEQEVDKEIYPYIDTDTMYNIAYGEMTMLNTHMIQKLYKIIDDQQKQINELKENM